MLSQIFTSSRFIPAVKINQIEKNTNAMWLKFIYWKNIFQKQLLESNSCTCLHQEGYDPTDVKQVIKIWCIDSWFSYPAVHNIHIKFVTISFGCFIPKGRRKTKEMSWVIECRLPAVPLFLFVCLLGVVFSSSSAVSPSSHYVPQCCHPRDKHY